MSFPPCSTLDLLLLTATHTRLPGLELSVILPSHSSAGITDVYHVWLCVGSEDSRFVLVRSALCPLSHLPRVCAITALPTSVSATLCYVVTLLRLPGVSGCPLSAFSQSTLLLLSLLLF